MERCSVVTSAEEILFLVPFICRQDFVKNRLIAMVKRWSQEKKHHIMYNNVGDFYVFVYVQA